MKIKTVLKEAFDSSCRYNLAWTRGLLVVLLPVLILSAIFFFLLLRWSPFSFLFMLILALLQSFMLAYINKFALTMVRNPQMVQRHLWQAVWYSISDGFLHRLIYSFLCQLIPMMLAFGAIMTLARFIWSPSFRPWFEENAGNIFGAFLVFLLFAPIIVFVLHILYTWLIDSHFFLLPYIIQDTASADNLLSPLSFFGSLKKSLSLIGGYRGRYVLLSFLLLLMPMSLEVIFIFLVRGVRPVLGETLASMLETVGIGLSVFLLIFTLVARTVFANALIERDPEIVDFGD